MSAFEGKADMTVCGNPLSRSLLGVKRTSLVAAQMSAFDPKRTPGCPGYRRHGIILRGIAGANVMKLRNHIAYAVAAVTNRFVPLVAGLIVIWFFGQSPAGAANIELQFSDNLSNNFGDQIDILITTANAPGPYPSNGSLITDITGTGFLSYNFGPPLGLFKYPVSLTGLPVGFGADNLLFSTFPFINENGIRLHTDSLLGFYTDFTLRAVPVGNGFRFDLCTSDCISNNVQTLSFTLTPVSDVANTPLPGALPLFATGLGALGLFGWRRKRTRAT